MLSLSPEFRAAMLTIEQTAPTFAEAMALVNRYRNPNPPPKPQHGAKVAVPVLKRWSPSPRPVQSPPSVKPDPSPPKVPGSALKAVRVKPIIVRRERNPKTADPTPDEIEAVCREIRSGWSEEETESRRTSNDVDMGRVAAYWQEINRGDALERWEALSIVATDVSSHGKDEPQMPETPYFNALAAEIIHHFGEGNRP